jgi:hypothetical protein
MEDLRYFVFITGTVPVAVTGTLDTGTFGNRFHVGSEYVFIRLDTCVV